MGHTNEILHWTVIFFRSQRSGGRGNDGWFPGKVFTRQFGTGTREANRQLPRPYPVSVF
jgi:hypothetical protein